MVELAGSWAYVTPRSWIDQATDEGEIDIAEDQHISLGVNGYIFTPIVHAGGIMTCPYCLDEYISADYFTDHLARDHSREEQDEYRRQQKQRRQQQGKPQDEREHQESEREQQSELERQQRLQERQQQKQEREERRQRNRDEWRRRWQREDRQEIDDVEPGRARDGDSNTRTASLPTRQDRGEHGSHSARARQAARTSNPERKGRYDHSARRK